MNFFYNRHGVGDVLIVQVSNDKPENVITESHGDVTVIKDEKSAEIVGFNLFNSSKYVAISEVGQVTLTQELVDKLSAALKENEVNIPLDVDFTPKFVVGHITNKESHPNADKLSVCSVDVGETTLQIVCGAPNVEAGQKVVVAKVGAVMPSGLVIRDAELRGIPSSGMICSASELALPDAEEGVGILVLEETSVVGQPYNK